MYNIKIVIFILTVHSYVNHMLSLYISNYYNVDLCLMVIDMKSGSVEIC